MTKRIKRIKVAVILGTRPEAIKMAPVIKELIVNKELYQKMTKAKNPYGDGKASIRIRKGITQFLRGVVRPW